MSTFTLLSHYLPTKVENYQTLADLLIPNRDSYCAKHGYKHHIHSGTYKDENLYYAVQRLHLLLDLMNKPDATDFYWVLNIQGVITNPNKKLEEFIDETHSFFAHGDINATINAGSFIIRNNEWGRKWIEFIIADTKEHNHCWHENHSMIRHCDNPNWKDGIKIMQHPGINSYAYELYSRGPETPGNWEKDHLVLSLPGLSLKERIAIVKSPLIQSIIN